MADKSKSSQKKQLSADQAMKEKYQLLLQLGMVEMVSDLKLLPPSAAPEDKTKKKEERK